MNWEKIESSTSSMSSGAIHLPEVAKKITWSGNLSFPECHIVGPEDLTPEIAELAKKVEVYADESQKLDSQRYLQALASGGVTSDYYLQANWSPFFWRFLREYCSTGDGKYIFYSSDKVSPSFGRYDSKIDIIEEATFKKKYFHFVGWFGRFWAFWKRHGDIIDIISENSYPSYPENLPLKKSNNQKYCDNWLTPWGKKAQCFYRVNYEFNFIENTFTEKNICSFYRDDQGNEQVLEPCFDIQY